MVIENQDLLTWVVPILAVLGGIGGLGVLISKYTETDKDDKFFARWVSVLKGITSAFTGTPRA